MSILGIDIGTSGIRVVAFSAAAERVAVEASDLTLLRPAPGRVELDPIALLGAVESAIRRIVTHPELTDDPVRAVSFSVLGEAILPTDDVGAPLAPVIVSMDGRGAGVAARLGISLGAGRFHEITGQPLHPMFSVFKLAAEDGPWSTAPQIHCVGDWITLRWTGRSAIDYGMAARTGAFDVTARQWSHEIIAALADTAPWVRADRLPTPAPAGEPVGTISPEVAERLGLPDGVLVVTGTHDQAAAWLGCGGDPGRRSCLSLGSSDCLTVGSSERPEGLHDTGLASYPVDERTWVTLAGTAAGGWALEWFTTLVGAADVGDVFDDLSPDPPALIVVPYLSGSGTLDNHPLASGLVHGLTLETTRPQLARAFLEAPGFEFARIVAAFGSRGVDPGEIIVTGAGAKNITGLQVRANALGRPLTPAPTFSTSRGAALLAARGLGLEAGWAAAVTRLDAAALTPDQTELAWYDAQRERYDELCGLSRTLTIRRSQP
ncbi:MAG: FGGY-family carbohydrate kinase [Propioniciclava sp.]